MTTGITFDTREAAVEYRDRKHTEGYTADISYDTMTGKYRVTIGTGLAIPPEEEFRETPGEIIKEEEAIEASIAIKEGMVCYGAKGETKKSCLMAGGNWITKIEAQALKAEARAVAEYAPMRPPTFKEREAARKAKRFGPAGLLRRPPEETPERLAEAGGELGASVLRTATKRTVGVRAGMKASIPRTTLSSTPMPMPDSIGKNGRRPRIMLVPKAPEAGKMPKPSGIPYLKTDKEKKEED